VLEALKLAKLPCLMEYSSFIHTTLIAIGNVDQVIITYSHSFERDQASRFLDKITIFHLKTI
jgi:hypothetical protein